ncbi:hypothetical protein DAMA08_008830 [Martiniozyma asiatica (nom. inval.)]|nr:hypothetical protein DAMA08_008830 [Martiniozyma asiatica]
MVELDMKTSGLGIILPSSNGNYFSQVSLNSTFSAPSIDTSHTADSTTDDIINSFLNFNDDEDDDDDDDDDDDKTIPDSPSPTYTASPKKIQLKKRQNVRRSKVLSPNTSMAHTAAKLASINSQYESSVFNLDYHLSSNFSTSPNAAQIAAMHVVGIDKRVKNPIRVTTTLANSNSSSSSNSSSPRKRSARTKRNKEFQDLMTTFQKSTPKKSTPKVYDNIDEGISTFQIKLKK